MVVLLLWMVAVVVCRCCVGYCGVSDFGGSHQLSAPHRCVCVCVCDGHLALPVATSLRCDSWQISCCFVQTVQYSKPLWRKEKWKQRPKGDVCDVKNYYGRC